ASTTRSTTSAAAGRTPQPDLQDVRVLPAGGRRELLLSRPPVRLQRARDVVRCGRGAARRRPAGRGLRQVEGRCLMSRINTLRAGTSRAAALAADLRRAAGG